jgi:ABC-2 type transport system ATP-binding protein
MSYDTHGRAHRHHPASGDVRGAGLHLRDVQTRQSSLEEIFVDLVKEGRA